MPSSPKRFSPQQSALWSPIAHVCRAAVVMPPQDSLLGRLILVGVALPSARPASSPAVGGRVPLEGLVQLRARAVDERRDGRRPVEGPRGRSRQGATWCTTRCSRRRSATSATASYDRV